jgi:hypothetical protein
MSCISPLMQGSTERPQNSLERDHSPLHLLSSTCLYEGLLRKLKMGVEPSCGARDLQSRDPVMGTAPALSTVQVSGVPSRDC